MAGRVTMGLKGARRSARWCKVQGGAIVQESAVLFDDRCLSEGRAEKELRCFGPSDLLAVVSPLRFLYTCIWPGSIMRLQGSTVNSQHRSRRQGYTPSACCIREILM
ncbi:hypothetical protein MGYG_00153 [Nannizzia gypsea CBS 118893]|uniref:Uncharacterized protein n=1 Tax=Arthroderma gypseum (strain ATCC MYA-4604 / CBS 118893) TaxID=535722 RepID=E5R382_ARTGP|nr:hypothetical protein MGYG_00153 [Nannizzia gypsea CBS 118893]EFQ97111.1 hypothetical protein MGYG_00153 [Nannizzia gypsea CBS 118893]